jgi:hypothetical protein
MNVIGHSSGGEKPALTRTQNASNELMKFGLDISRDVGSPVLGAENEMENQVG